MSNGENQQPESGVAAKKNSPVLLIALAVITAAAGFFGYKTYDGNRRNAEQQVKMRGDSLRIADLDGKYTSTLTELNAYKGLNAQLDSIIAVRENDLNDCRKEFLSLVRKNQMTEDAYKKQTASLNNIDSTFQSQIMQLQADNKLLKIQRDSLGRLVLVQNDSIAMLNDSAASLSKKVLIGSLLKPTNITVVASHSRSNNKDATTKKATKTDQLKICFNIPQNDIARADTQVFFIRIIDPDGKTLSNQSATKIITRADTKEEIPYSTKATVNYKNVATNTCIYFRQDVTYTKGSYTIEIYQNGYPVGSQKFALK